MATVQNSNFDWDEHNKHLARWVQTEEARQAFRNIDKEIQEETDSLRKRTIINYEECQKQFTI
jgi:hypothetical protein